MQQSSGSADADVGERATCCSDCGRHIGALMSFDDFLLSKELRRRAEADPFSEWSTPDDPAKTVVASKKTASRRVPRDGAPALAESRGGQRSVTYSEDEWILRYKLPYWRTMVDREAEYIPDNGCYRCMKMRSYPDDLDSFRPERHAAARGDAAPRSGGEPRQLQREVTRDLHRQFRLVVQAREPGAEPGSSPSAAATHSAVAAASPSKQPFAAIREQAIVEDESEESAAAAASSEQPPINLPTQKWRASVGGSQPARSNAASVTLSFAPPSAADAVYELPGGSLSILDEYTAKELVALSRTLSRIPDLGSKFSFGDKLLSFGKQSNGEVKPIQLAKRALPLREAFVLADDALRVKKLARKRDLRPVEKVTPKFRQMEDSTRLASTLAKLRYTTTSGSVVSLPVYASSTRSHSASLPADGEPPGKTGGGTVSAPMALRGVGDAAASQTLSAPASPEVKLKLKGRKADTKGFALPDDGIQEKCLPEIAGIRITTLSGSHR